MNSVEHESIASSDWRRFDRLYALAILRFWSRCPCGSRVEKDVHLWMFLPRNVLDRVEAGLLIIYIRETQVPAEEKRPVLNHNDTQLHRYQLGT